MRTSPPNSKNNKLTATDPRIDREQSAAAVKLVESRNSDSKRATLRQKDILGNLTPLERAQVLSRCVEHQYYAGVSLYTQGTRHIDTFIIKSGLVRTYYSSPMGREIALAYWSDGDLLGGPNFFDEEGTHLWSAEAVENCTVLAIKGNAFRTLASHIPALAEQVFDVLSFKLHWHALAIQMLGTESVGSRLANLLMMLSELYGIECEDGIEIKYFFSQEDLAQMVGATRQWINTALSHLQRSRIIRSQKRRLIILDIDSLRSLVK